MPVNELKALTPVVGMRIVEGDDVAGHAAIGAILRNHGQALFNHAANIAAGKRGGNAGGDELAAIDSLAIVRDAGSFACEPCGALGIARIDQSPRVDKDLSADLLRHRAAVLGDGTGLRRGNTRP